MLLEFLQEQKLVDNLPREPVERVDDDGANHARPHRLAQRSEAGAIQCDGQTAVVDEGGLAGGLEALRRCQCLAGPLLRRQGELALVLLGNPRIDGGQRPHVF
jgi:hypothetical protein